MGSLARFLLLFGGFILPSVRGLAVPYANDVGIEARSNDGKPLQGTDIPTGNPFNCSYPTKYFRQLMNHPSKDGGYNSKRDSSSKSDTFLQQYQLITDFFKPGGPIIFYQGAEGPINCMEYEVHLQYAMDLGGIAAMLEHRFFGLSVTGNLSYETNLEWPTSALESLTLDNVLQDSVEFIEWIKSTVPGAKDSKAITFGGSYAGWIVALEKIHYPETFFAAFPTAAPFRGLISDPKDPLIYGWGNWVQQVLLDASPTVSRRAAKALKDLRHRLTSGNFEGMKDKLSLCTQPNSSSQADMLLNQMIDGYSSAAQYSFSATGLSFNTLINQTLLAGDGTFETLGPAVKLLLASQSTDCLDWDNSNKRTPLTLPFQWMVCTYAPYPDRIYRTDSHIFGPNHPDPSLARLNDDQCQKAFGINSIDAGVEYQKALGIDQESLEASTRMFFNLGTRDPATSLGLIPFWARDNREQSRVFITTGAAHGEDAFPSVPLDSVAKNETKLAQLNTMKEWLGLYDLPEVYPAYSSSNDTDILYMDPSMLAVQE